MTVQKNRSVVLPGATIGVLGSGQLGRMFAIAARRMGYRVHTFSPDEDTPTGQIADYEVTASYDDLDAVREFARHVSVVTFEFENVSAACVEAASEFAPVRPGGSVLHTAQHRLREKTFLSRHGFPVAPFRHVTSPGGLTAAIAEIGCPAVLKTAGFGYDGKGQSKIVAPDEAGQALAALGGREAVLEAFIDFDCEVSVVAARGLAVVSDGTALTAAVDAAIAANPDVAQRIRDGKVQAAGALIGAVMKAMRGQADAARVRELVLERLS